MKIQSEVDFELAVNSPEVRELESAGWTVRLSPLARKYRTIVLVKEDNVYRVQGNGALRKQSTGGTHIVRERAFDPEKKARLLARARDFAEKNNHPVWFRYGSGLALEADYANHLTYLVNRLRKGTL
jgi:hypothetical protein